MANKTDAINKSLDATKTNFWKLKKLVYYHSLIHTLFDH